MQWWLIVVIVICAIAAVVIALLFLDKYLRREKIQEAVKMVPLKTTLKPRTYRNTLIVYLPGILANADMISPRVLKTWAEHGEVWGANYIPPRFLPDRIVYEVSNWISERLEKDDSAQRLILIGSSMGGLLAYGIHQRVADHLLMKNTVFCDVMVIDAPTGREDLQRPLNLSAPVVRILPFGPIWNHLSGLIMKFLFIPPKEGEIDSDVDPVWLAEQVEGARSFPLSFWRDQIMYILNHGVPTPGSVSWYSRMVYVRSTEDTDTVRPSAVRVWSDVFQPGRSSFAWQFKCFEARGAKHAAYAQNPSSYEEVFPKVFKALER